VRVSGNYGTHLAALIKTMSLTDGDVLELGMGVFSTPFLHYQCILSDRKLVSYDNEEAWIQWFIKYGYQNKNHEIKYVKEWDDADIERPWDVVLVDHSPGHRRIEEVKRLAKWAKYIIIHDANERHDKEYRYSTIYPLFKYKKTWIEDVRHTVVLSNFVDLKNLWK